eukprot:CAMPEP_0176401662 /NCGR_PEP_ID=MMETSP0126-20121128/48620_1 /TAXON_ID=141414 ORGANISM="Strombidinopsis acuminatum, Strain SPMC142" /NCGR_SAMPLE_ID=MMETSP0126 /ASSEMBLY_ACC=CAM_ASM_000229 /LENGTH=43 /DNA_ID= /DNA_START= /DNA_END= /DNA_ORIENTATION=
MALLREGFEDDDSKNQDHSEHEESCNNSERASPVPVTKLGSSG